MSDPDRTGLRVVLQLASETLAGVPAEADFMRWAGAAGAGLPEGTEVAVRVCDETESAALNSRYRGKSGPTNVLSFPAELPPGVDLPLLGDLVICAPVVAREAAEQQKDPLAHWAHMVVHGILHLRGHDHVEAAEAARMEALEVSILADLGLPDPYNGD
jgi:probable rRNA maturation factor